MEVIEGKQLSTSLSFPQNVSLFIHLIYFHKMCGILPNLSVRRVKIPNKYAKYTAANILANWNIDKFNNVFKIFVLNFKNFNVDQRYILTLKAVTHYIHNWFPKHEANLAK
jgi:hypothetical protein